MSEVRLRVVNESDQARTMVIFQKDRVLGSGSYEVAAWDVATLAPQGGQRDLVVVTRLAVQARVDRGNGTISSGIKHSEPGSSWRIENQGYLDIVPTTGSAPQHAAGDTASVSISNSCTEQVIALTVRGGIAVLGCRLAPGATTRFDPGAAFLITVSDSPIAVGSLHAAGSIGSLGEPFRIDLFNPMPPHGCVRVSLSQDDNGRLHFESDYPSLLARFSPASSDQSIIQAG